MERERKRRIVELATLSNDLREFLAALNAELAAVERDLETVDLDEVIDVEGTIPLDQELDQTEDRIVLFEARLAYGLYQRRRRLLVRSYKADDPDIGIEDVSGADGPLLECPAPLRGAAVTSGALDELLKLIRRRTETLLNDARAAAMRLASSRSS